METDLICLPEPLGCFKVPTGGSSSFQDNSDDGDYTDDDILSDVSVIAALRAQEPEGCLLCLTEISEDED